MNAIGVIKQMAIDNNGIVTSSMVDSAHISRGNLKYLCDKGVLTKGERGVYYYGPAVDDEYYNVQQKYKKGIYSLETVLYFANLSDRAPEFFSMTFPINYNTSALKSKGVYCHNIKSDLYDVGIVEYTTPYGNIVRGYCVERTLCEILKKTNKVDIQVITNAFKCYSKLKIRNIPLLSRYSKMFGVEQTVRRYLEVLL